MDKTLTRHRLTPTRPSDQLPASNASLSRAQLATSAEDAGENIMAATSACRPAKRIPEEQGNPRMLLNVTPLNVRLIRFLKVFLTDGRISPLLQ
jgi:hypothetical protein